MASNPLRTRLIYTAAVVTLLFSCMAQAVWKPADGPLMTKWAKDVSPEKVHPEYPRPQMVREDWLNLNGLWDYAIKPKDASRPDSFDGQILVPFPAESALSGVMKPVGPDNRLWYRRTFTIPEKWAADKKRILLHFGAVDWDATVWVNGKEVGNHKGGYDPFTFDITDAVETQNLASPQEIVVSVWDPTDAGTQPHGKQVLKPGGIMYTAVTGIWQTVWVEPVPETCLTSVRITPDVDKNEVRFAFDVAGNPSNWVIDIRVKDGQGKFVAEKNATYQGQAYDVAVNKPKLWSPDSPHLYAVTIALRSPEGVVDQFDTYFAMRKSSLGKDENGILRLCLNNKPLFQYGPLDQGWWPDGLYTAPTDEALKYDIEVLKQLGMNMARKHVKVEPDRWYYWCDNLGLLVWQDMPSGDNKTDDAKKQFELELQRMIHARRNHPCIVMWVPFNEGWGQYDTLRIVDLVRKLDASRLVDNASGWTDQHVGDVSDVHDYPGPKVPPIEEKRAAVLGEFGGLGLPLPGHTWQAEKNWGYRSFTTRDELTDAYLGLIRKLHPMTGAPGLSAAVYTQTTDCEVEVNGLMTYDREIIKMDVPSVTAANKTLYTPPQPRRAEGDKLIPPATPLVACDPYFSIWSPADKLTDEDTVHWTGKPHRLTSMVRIDGKPYRIMGASPGTVPALPQTSLTVLPTHTIYTSEGAGVGVTLTFMTAALPEDIEILSRPVTYLTYEFHATDDKTHNVAFYFDASAELTVNQGRQQVVHSEQQIGDLDVLKIGSEDQPILAKKGDDIRIDWGYLYVAAMESARPFTMVAPRQLLSADFAKQGVPRDSDVTVPREAAADTLVAALAFDVGEVSKRPVSRWLMLAYDDLYSIQYMQKNLRPYWRRNGWDAGDLLKAAANDYESLQKRCAAFDEELMADLTKAGGEKYAKLCALAYRQCFAAGKFVADDNGQPLQFCKENHSNGCISTSDVFYPMAPQFLLFGPSIAKSFLVPFMNYAASDRWKFPFAPHDLGTYPKANGQVYGGGERTEENQMPVEESGNLLLLMAAIAQMEGNANLAGLYWPRLEQWAEYLKGKGFDPEKQLCTDDFAGHLAHNVNLSVKAICGLGAFAKLCDMRGDQAKAAEYSKIAKEFAARWVKEADDGDYFRLAFDKSGTWSQKCNLVWDRILDLNLFPPEVVRKEMEHYKKIQNRYGLPLDNRETYTKLDWTLWTATLTQDRSDFEAIVNPVYLFMNETPDRSPLTDWYWTKNARKRGFTGRPVIGGVFLQMLYDKAVWHKYAGRDKTKAANWAPMPKPPVIVSVAPTAQDEPVAWRYTTQRPAAGWFKPDFDAGAWKEGKSGFGTQGTPGAIVNTVWDTPNIWLRREFTLPESKWDNIELNVHHDEDVEIYINGMPAATATGYTTAYEPLPLNATAKAALKPGKNLLAIHCRQTGGGQYIDVGLVERIERK